MQPFYVLFVLILSVAALADKEKTSSESVGLVKPEDVLNSFEKTLPKESEAKKLRFYPFFNPFGYGGYLPYFGYGYGGYGYC
ncbi:unnamed protein product [Haemonchus placei]|uniref:Uncharacterized protein n=1 Tax=Haemonchus placei TaxID=6290 RepID=A0A0N4WK53_HAEPC|nr:unnamed protein product [Haemonchus placei]